MSLRTFFPFGKNNLFHFLPVSAKSKHLTMLNVDIYQEIKVGKYSRQAQRFSHTIDSVTFSNTDISFPT